LASNLKSQRNGATRLEECDRTKERNEKDFKGIVVIMVFFIVF